MNVTALTLAAAGLLLAAASCMARPAGTPGVAVGPSTAPSAAAKDAEAVQAPPMFAEAKLPAGFPPPGPLDRVILKQYPAYRAARTQAAPGTKDAADAMFRPLFNHIKRNDIAMTAPVEMTYAAGAGDAKPAGDGAPEPVAMAFVYRQPTVGRPGADGDVTVLDLPAVTVLSVAIRGSYTPERFRDALALIRKSIDDTGGRFVPAGPPRYLGYNSPFVPAFLRLGEVQLPVTGRDGPATQPAAATRPAP